MNSIFDVLHALVDRVGLHDLTERAHEIISEADPVKPDPEPDPAAELAALKAQVAELTAAKQAEAEAAVPEPEHVVLPETVPDAPVHTGNPF